MIVENTKQTSKWAHVLVSQIICFYFITNRNIALAYKTKLIHYKNLRFNARVHFTCLHFLLCCCQFYWDLYMYYIYRFIDAEKFSAQKWLISWWWRQPSELSSNYWPVNQFNFPPAVWPLCKRVWLYQFFRITSFFIIDTVDTRTYETVSLPIRKYFRLISFFYSCFNL